MKNERKKFIRKSSLNSTLYLFLFKSITKQVIEKSVALGKHYHTERRIIRTDMFEHYLNQNKTALDFLGFVIFVITGNTIQNQTVNVLRKEVRQTWNLLWRKEKSIV